jgi:hypothetical protein
MTQDKPEAIPNDPAGASRVEAISDGWDEIVGSLLYGSQARIIDLTADLTQTRELLVQALTALNQFGCQEDDPTRPCGLCSPCVARILLTPPPLH